MNAIDLIQKYGKDLSQMGIQDDEMRRLPLEILAQYIEICFESNGKPTPDDVKFLLNNNQVTNNDANNNTQNNEITISDSDNDYKNNYKNEDDELQKVLQASKEEYQHQNNIHHQPPPELPIFDLKKIRRLFTDNEVASNRNISLSRLLAYRREIVMDLAQFDSIVGARYNDTIKKEIQNIGDAPPQGITIAVLLPNGERCTRIFGPEDIGRSVYIWVASQQKMIHDKIKPGHFVIVKNNGDEIMPSNSLNEMISENRILLNVRLM
ncbi:hypothetical protein TRFO_06774 [Tritrichomonas foetus]|uniref:UBX domain-containing protein n=1 Tax=Tritrichomonas foetus TaxID=1144522 RepID=A0A1J4K059_9EUKA|nr:hypothetical protein TRFO_06774 [Tritrichomonas foetus]|eukprot:OHT03126.1 hypothetical protein TRFO_06774 [Tritrichomonas foetus]